MAGHGGIDGGQLFFQGTAQGLQSLLDESLGLGRIGKTFLNSRLYKADFALQAAGLGFDGVFDGRQFLLHGAPERGQGLLKQFLLLGTIGKTFLDGGLQQGQLGLKGRGLRRHGRLDGSQFFLCRAVQGKQHILNELDGLLAAGQATVHGTFHQYQFVRKGLVRSADGFQ